MGPRAGEKSAKCSAADDNRRHGITFKSCQRVSWDSRNATCQTESAFATRGQELRSRQLHFANPQVSGLCDPSSNGPFSAESLKVSEKSANPFQPGASH